MKLPVRVLVVNAGSSSVKVAVVDDRDRTLAADKFDRDPDHRDPATGGAGLSRTPDLARFVDDAPPFDAVGHRVVHGADHRGPVLLSRARASELSELAGLAPLHNPPALALIEELAARLPGVPQIACFDTTFHATLPEKATVYALPPRWRDEWGVRRYGFHGLSHAWVAHRVAELLGRPVTGLRTISAHVGAGASLAAVSGGRSLDTTMGFTPMEGLVMATRSGSVDPGAVLWALRHGGLRADEVEDDLERRSGLLGLSERSGDLREVITGMERGDRACTLAYEVYVYRIQKAVGEMAVALAGVDVLAFTGGAGFGSGRLRRDVCAGLAVIGIDQLPEEGESRTRGARPESDRVESRPGKQPVVAVVEAREDLEIARQVRKLLAG